MIVQTQKNIKIILFAGMARNQYMLMNNKVNLSKFTLVKMLLNHF